MPPSGKYLLRIAPADAMVIDFGVKKMSCGVVDETNPLLNSSKQ
jgi:hypothetical protein